LPGCYCITFPFRCQHSGKRKFRKKRGKMRPAGKSKCDECVILLLRNICRFTGTDDRGRPPICRLCHPCRGDGRPRSYAVFAGWLCHPCRRDGRPGRSSAELPVVSSMSQGRTPGAVARRFADCVIHVAGTTAPGHTPCLPVVSSMSQGRTPGAVARRFAGCVIHVAGTDDRGRPPICRLCHPCRKDDRPRSPADLPIVSSMSQGRPPPVVRRVCRLVVSSMSQGRTTGAVVPTTHMRHIICGECFRIRV